MVTPLSSTSHAVLGLLSLRSWTTYELTKQVQRSLGWFWPRAERKLYDEPKRLVAAGFATGEKEMTGARPRTVYAITRAGRRALRRWLDEPSTAPTLEFEGLVKVFLADGGSLDQLRSTLQAIAETSDERLAELQEKADQMLDPAAAFGERVHLNTVALRFQHDHERTFGTWARWALEQTDAWASSTDAGDWDHFAALEAIGTRQGT